MKIFSQLLQKTPTGYYELKLPWKENHIPLPTNGNLSAARLGNTTRTLERTGKLQECDQLMQKHVTDGIMEPVPTHPTGEVVDYIHHRAL